MNQISLYQTVHTLAGRIFHLEEHLKILFEAYYQVFSGYVDLSPKEAEALIAAAITRNRCPKDRSLFVTLSLSDSGQLSCSKVERSLYEGYTMRCVVPRGAIVEFELPHAKYPTSISLSLTAFANSVATKRGGDVAIRSYKGTVDMVNGAQLFALTQQGVITDKESHSVEHAKAKELLRRTGIAIIERPIEESELPLLDELFYADHHGVTALRSGGGRYYMSITATALATALAEITA